MVHGSPGEDRIVRFGTFELDPDSGELHRAGLRVPLQQQPFTILVHLLEHPGEVVTRDELQRELWADATFGDFEHGLNAAIKRLRDALDDSADNPRFIETLPRRGYRFVAAVHRGGSGGVPTAAGEPGTSSRWGFRRFPVAAMAAPLIVGALAAVIWRVGERPVLEVGDRDTILVADFVNRTGDAVFDGTLKQALRTQIEQSPSFRLASNEQVRQTLKLMTRSPDEAVTGDVAREVCRRAGAKIALNGSIARLGSRYVIGLEAAVCESGEAIAEQQVEAADREHVLDAVGAAATRVRRRLGESAANLRRFNVVVTEATTASLEALKAFSVAEQVRERQGSPPSEPYYLRAIELDPEFAMPYARLAAYYQTFSRFEEGRRMAFEAYARRGRVTERERFYIESGHCRFAQSNPDCPVSISELWKQTYPLDWSPYVVLCNAQLMRGDYARGLPNCMEGVRLAPENYLAYDNLASTLLALNRFDDAKQVTDAALAHHVEAGAIRTERFSIAAAIGDARGMDEERAAVRGTAEEFRLVRLDSEAAAAGGRLKDARALRARAAQLTKGQFERWTREMNSFGMLVEAAVGFVGRCSADRAQPTLLELGTRGVQLHANVIVAALLCRDYRRAESLLRELDDSAPFATPARTMLAVDTGNREAIAHLPPAAAVELEHFSEFKPVYLRGLAYLHAGDGAAAAIEFQRILDHRGVAPTSPLYPLAHVQQARAYVVADDVAEARRAYESFFKLWERADPDVPILIAARAEYTRLPAAGR